jgi:hypothetical protein
MNLACRGERFPRLHTDSLLPGKHANHEERGKYSGDAGKEVSAESLSPG